MNPTWLGITYSRIRTAEQKWLILLSFFSGENTPSTDTSNYLQLLPEVCRSVIYGPPCINDSIPTNTNIEQMYVYASELREFWHFYILKLLFLSIFCRHIENKPWLNCIGGGGKRPPPPKKKSTPVDIMI